jgi:SAM-dependent methyltransferase
MLPALYHAHHQQYQEDLPFWLDLARQNPPEVLELGCGTGRILIPLADNCSRVFGLDRDAHMLVFLGAQLNPSQRQKIHYFQANFTQFQLSIHFGLIFIACNTYSTLSQNLRRLLLKNTFRHLRPGGLFAVSLPNPEILVQMPKHGAPEIENYFSHPLDGEPVQVSSSWERTKSSFTISWIYDHLLPDGRVERQTALVSHQLTSVDSYLEEFNQAGFRSVLTYGNFDSSPYSISSQYLILVAQR